MVSQPNGGDTNYLQPFAETPDYLGTHDRGHGYIYPMSDTLNLYKAYFYRTFPADLADYIPNITTEMAKEPTDRIHLYTGCHTAGAICCRFS